MAHWKEKERGGETKRKEERKDEWKSKLEK